MTVEGVSCVHDRCRRTRFADVIGARDLREAVCSSGAAPALCSERFAVGLAPGTLLLSLDCSGADRKCGDGEKEDGSNHSNPHSIN